MVGTFLVDKTSGAVYDCSRVFIAGQDYINRRRMWKNRPVATSDKYGNIYYANPYTYNDYSMELHKIDISNPNHLTDEIITPDGGTKDWYLEFTVSKNGEVMFLNRLRTRKGRFIRYEESNDRPAFCGLDGRVHYYSYFQGRHHHLAINFHEDESISVDTIGYLEDEFGLPVYVQDGYLVKSTGTIISVGCTNAEMVVIDSRDGRIGRVYRSDNSIEVTDLSYNQSYIYYSGQTNDGAVLVKVDVDNYGAQTIFKNDDYEIYSFVVDKQGNIQFNGSRISDGKSVIALVDINGKLTILSESADKEKITLVRVQ